MAPHTQVKCENEKTAASAQPSSRVMFMAAVPYSALIGPTSIDGRVRCHHCGQQVAKRGVTQHLIKHALAGEIELQLHKTGNGGGMYTVFVNREGKQY